MFPLTGVRFSPRQKVRFTVGILSLRWHGPLTGCRCALAAVPDITSWSLVMSLGERDEEGKLLDATAKRTSPPASGVSSTGAFHSWCGGSG